MSTAEATLIAHLVDLDAVETIAHAGLAPSMLPTEDLRPVLAFAMDYYYATGCTAAPSATVLRDEFGPELDEAEVDLEHEPDDAIEWALDHLQSHWVHRQAERFNRDFAISMSEAQRSERVDVVNEYSTRLVELSLSMESRAYRVELSDAGDDILRRYESRVATRGQFRGMGFGLSDVDNRTNGIHTGELAILAGAPKSGKSYFICWVALQEFQRGRTVSLFTLENSVEMTLDRIACMATGVPTDAWDQGRATDQEVERVLEWRDELAKINASDGQKLWVLKPDLEQRSMPYMVREAQLRRSDSILIDQLTHVEVGHGPSDRRARTEKIGESLHQLKAMVSSGRRPMVCLLAHQVNREGVKHADKAGYLEAWHMAESAEVERTADFVFGLYSSREERTIGRAKLQMLAARRTPIKHWNIRWEPHVGNVRVLSEFIPEDQ